MTREKTVSGMFKALCDENRVRILDCLTSGEQCACILLEELNVAQSTLSHHMKVLCDSGLVTGRKEGKWMYYSISQEGVAAAIDYLTAIGADKTNGKGTSCCEE